MAYHNHDDTFDLTSSSTYPMINCIRFRNIIEQTLRLSSFETGLALVQFNSTQNVTVDLYNLTNTTTTTTSAARGQVILGVSKF